MKTIKLPDFKYLENEVEFTPQKQDSWVLKTTKKLGLYIFSGITFLGWLIVYSIFNSAGKIEFEVLVQAILVGLLLMTPFLIYLGFENYRYRKLERQQEKDFDEFKHKAIKLPVDLKKAKIKKRANNFCITNFEIPYIQKAIIIDYEAIIQMSSDRLYLHFIAQKETIFYVNEDDIHKHYLDLSFLD